MSTSIKLRAFASFLCLFHLSIAVGQTQEAAPVPTAETSVQPASHDEFESILSLGYRPKKESSTLNLQFVNLAQESVIKVFSFSTLLNTKLADVKNKTSIMQVAYLYGLTDNTNIGLKIGNYFSNKGEYKYTASAKANGNVDFNTSRSGSQDPDIYLDYVFIRHSDLLVVGDLEYSPNSGDSTSSNALRGGSSAKFGLNVYKAIGLFEYGGGIHLENFSTRTNKSDDGTVTEKFDGNRLSLGLSINMYVTPKASILFEGGYIQVAASTDKTGSSKVENDSYGIGTAVLGFQYALAKSLSFQAALTGTSMDSITATTNSARYSQDGTKAAGVGIGLKFGF